MLNVESEGAVRRLTLNRPEVRNAFNEELIARLTEAFQDLAGVRAVVLTGAGSAFCGGGDLDWMRRAADKTEAENREDALRLAHLYQAICDCPAVVIARVNGAAFGGACGLVAAADVAVAHPTALFAFSEVRLGLVAATISPFVLRKIGAGHARALLTTGEAFDADRALRIGLIHEVAEDLDAAVEQKLKAVLSAGPEAVAASKSLAQNPPLDLDSAADLLARTRAGAEAREGIDAFLTKRRAAFTEPR